MTLACLIIAIAEFAAATLIVARYIGAGEPIDLFLSRAPLQDVIRVRVHALTCFTTLQMATIFSLVRA